MKLRFRRPKGIPVGKDGYVPLKEIVRRYQEIGDPRDSDSDDPVIQPRMLTPEEIEQWWDDPSVCDIDGVDTKESDSARGSHESYHGSPCVSTDSGFRNTRNT